VRLSELMKLKRIDHHHSRANHTAAFIDAYVCNLQNRKRVRSGHDGGWSADCQAALEKWLKTEYKGKAAAAKAEEMPAAAQAAARGKGKMIADGVELQAAQASAGSSRAKPRSRKRELSSSSSSSSGETMKTRVAEKASGSKQAAKRMSGAEAKELLTSSLNDLESLEIANGGCEGCLAVIHSAMEKIGEVLGAIP